MTIKKIFKISSWFLLFSLIIAFSSNSILSSYTDTGLFLDMINIVSFWLCFFLLFIFLTSGFYLLSFKIRKYKHVSSWLKWWSVGLLIALLIVLSSLVISDEASWEVLSYIDFFLATTNPISAIICWKCDGPFESFIVFTTLTPAYFLLWFTVNTLLSFWKK